MRRLWPLLAAVALAALVWAPPSVAKRAYEVHRDLDYRLGSTTGAARSSDLLDLYAPRGQVRRPQPVVVWIHGGGWRGGDKRLGIRKKAELFTEAGYLLASVNYRLSSAPFDPEHPDPDRVMFPDHPRDIGEALGWLDRNLHVFNGDRRRILLIGHSAGAHLAALVATQPRYLQRWGVRPKQVRGFVSLDTPSFDIAAGADPETSLRPQEGRLMFWNAFGTPEENLMTGDWAAASPSMSADRNDPPGLLVTQAGNDQRLSDHRAMALALGRAPARTVLPVELDHRAINRQLGPGSDRFGVTAAVLDHARRAFAR